MTFNASEENISSAPSKLREAGSRHEDIVQRIKVVKDFALSEGLHAPEGLTEDEHFWFITMNTFHLVESKLKEPISDADIRRSTAISIAIDQAAEKIDLEKKAATDGLTGAWSRRSLDNFLGNMIKRQRQNSLTGVMLIDIDHFKKFNDEQGHPAGDQILKDLVSLLIVLSRGDDMVSRYGGEEFCLVLPGGGNSINERAEEIRKNIQERCSFTVSIGTTSIRPEDDSIETVYQRVDHNLYTVKENGRNNVADENGLINPAN
jgi:diguanylate cyclase (GGDEF)-like protein